MAIPLLSPFPRRVLPAGRLGEKAGPFEASGGAGGTCDSTAQIRVSCTASHAGPCVALGTRGVHEWPDHAVPVSYSWAAVSSWERLEDGEKANPA